SGRWMALRSSKNAGSCARTRSAQRRLFSRSSRRSAIAILPDVRRPAGPAAHDERAAGAARRALLDQAFAVAAPFARFFARSALARVFRSVTLRGRARFTAAFVAPAFFVGLLGRAAMMPTRRNSDAACVDGWAPCPIQLLTLSSSIFTANGFVIGS